MLWITFHIFLGNIRSNPSNEEIQAKRFPRHSPTAASFPIECHEFKICSRLRSQTGPLEPCVLIATRGGLQSYKCLYIRCGTFDVKEKDGVFSSTRTYTFVSSAPIQYASLFSRLSVPPWLPPREVQQPPYFSLSRLISALSQQAMQHRVYLSFKRASCCHLDRPTQSAGRMLEIVIYYIQKFSEGASTESLVARDSCRYVGPSGRIGKIAE